MRIIEVIPSKCWFHIPSGRTASIYGSVPYSSDLDQSQWEIRQVGWTWRLSNGTIGLGRPPALTESEARKVMDEVNTRRGY